MTEPAIQTTALTRAFGPVTAVDQVSLTVRAGEILGFVGPNGAGKSTFLKMLVGLVRPTSGAARVLGMDAARESLAIRRRVGYLPGDLGLYRNLPAGYVLDFCLGFHPRADRERARALAADMGLPLERRIKHYSTGMRQKIGILQALCVGADVLLLDEPTQGLDPTSRAAFLDLLREERAKGTSVLLSSHILSEVEEIADRIEFLDRGRVLPADRVDAARAAFRRRLRVVFSGPVSDADLAAIPDLHVVERRDREALLRVDGDLGDALLALARLGLDAIDYNRPDLEEMYRLLYLAPAGRRAADAAATEGAR